MRALKLLQVAAYTEGLVAALLLVSPLRLEAQNALISMPLKLAIPINAFCTKCWTTTRRSLRRT